MLENSHSKLFWEFAWSTSSARTTNEYIFVKSKKNPQVHPIVSVGPVFSEDENKNTTLPFEELKIDGSILSIVRSRVFTDSENQERILNDLQAWFSGITSLELLSPIAMRRGARGKQEDIGPRGEYLASFLASIDSEKRDRIVKRGQRFFPLNSLNTTRKRAGWVDMQLAENFKDFQRIGPAHMSDGFFRLLGMCAIPEFEHSSSLILLDEVEDGIEPHILPDLIRQIDAETEGQLIMTSHSPLLINSFDPKQTIVVARDEFGRTRTAEIEDIPDFEQGLEYFGSGEIWANSDREGFYDHVRKPIKPSRPKKQPVEQLFDRVMDFLQ